MANVNIKFNGKEFLLSCENGQEEHLEELALVLNEKFDKLKSSLGNIGENKLLLITAITIVDEYFETKKNIEIKKKEIINLKDKFKELKFLVNNYRDEKESYIEKLQSDIHELRNDLDANKNECSKIIEKASNEIEEFLEKTRKETSIQQ
tara:strand:- start:298 stop:747 length:450 start_codon:yes stop_codon:yes gene_type:complete